MGVLKRFFSKQSSKYGYMNQNYEVIIPPKYSEGVYSFGSDSEGNCQFGIVRNNNHFGVVNEAGTQIIPTIYQEIYIIKNQMFIVRKEELSSWQFGVIDDSNKTIVPFEYKYIHIEGDFLHCFYNANCNKEEHKITLNEGIAYTYDKQEEETWFTLQGKEIHLGEGKVLSSTYLAIKNSNTNKYGIVNNLGQCLSSFIYKDVIYMNNYFFASTETGIDIIDIQGRTIFSSLSCMTNTNIVGCPI